MTSTDSKHNLKESTSTAMPSSGAVGGNVCGGGNAALTSVVTSGSSTAIGSQPLSAANHLEIPSNNPNLLSPDILNQRRGIVQLCRNSIKFTTKKEKKNIAYTRQILIFFLLDSARSHTHFYVRMWMGTNACTLYNCSTYIKKIMFILCFVLR